MYKVPQSVLVVIFTAELQVLMLRRTHGDGLGAEFWQSVTGSKAYVAEPWEVTAAREVREETGIDVRAPGNKLQDWELENLYPIHPQWLHRYAPSVGMNVEHVFGLLVPSCVPVRLNPQEHTAYAWHHWQAAADLCYAPSNAQAILHLPVWATA